MSGSGSSSGVGSGTGGSGGPCENLDARTVLQSPVQDVLEGIAVGELLEVALKEHGGRSQVLILREGEVAGSLVFRGLRRLIECLEEGFVFEAAVESIVPGSVTLRIRPT